MKEVIIPKVEKGLVDREKLAQESRETAKALWHNKLTANEQKALSLLCQQYGLDPLQKQIVVLGGNFYITKGGLLGIAEKREDKPEGIEVVPATAEEREAARCPEKSHYWKAILWKRGHSKPFIEFGEANDDSERWVNIGQAE